MSAIPKTMTAWIAACAGQPKDILELKTNWPIPSSPSSGQIMVQVNYVALNPGDLKMMAHNVPFRGPFIPCMDFVGEVVQVGPSTPALRVGMMVAGTTSFWNVWTGVGVLAEYVVVSGDVVVEKPEDLDASLAPGLLGVAGQTSYVLTRTANMRKGDKALVNGASGGVGCILTQALRGMGVHVTAISSAKNEAMVRRFGAEEVLSVPPNPPSHDETSNTWFLQFVDYTAHASVYDYLDSLYAAPEKESFGVIFDCVGDDTLFYRSPKYLKVDGKFLSIEAGPFGFLRFINWQPVILGGTPRNFVSVFSSPSANSAREVVTWFNKGWIKEVPVDSLFAMEDVLEALEKLATRRTAGKIIIKVEAGSG
ncbi:hypothetical protein S40288_09578 [Stachybotrys chartarum IBT 40288]|nr:hypothetical protein S40288_09578 [Stachybotrys chartarum IBT 40288]